MLLVKKSTTGDDPIGDIRRGKVLQEGWEEMKSTWDDDEEEGLL